MGSCFSWPALQAAQATAGKGARVKGKYAKTMYFVVTRRDMETGEPLQCAVGGCRRTGSKHLQAARSRRR